MLQEGVNGLRPEACRATYGVADPNDGPAHVAAREPLFPGTQAHVHHDAVGGSAYKAFRVGPSRGTTGRQRALFVYQLLAHDV